MKRLSAFSNRHPVLSQIVGWILVAIIALVALPKDPDYVDAAVHAGRTT
jgi:hypothetical protein